MSTPSTDIPPSTTIQSSSTSQDATAPPSDSIDRADRPDKPPSPPRPLRRYSRKQLVRLSASPLVKPPENMPELKAWFGADNESALKKDDPPTPSTARERRFRRDAEDGDAPARPSFRAALSQPSQMGNFKHQSLRADRERDRDRDRDGDKAKIGDTTRLQDLSDRYDRDRLGLPLTNSRTKERDLAPHLAANTRSSQALSSNAASRRGDTREVGKKKVGEAEDWRRGAEPRGSRDDRTDNRREDRERARSRNRDSSRSRRDPSTGRRDKDTEGPRERHPRGERDDYRREKDDSRRERDADSEDDPRRWRDDGKREERLAGRRDRRDKAGNDSWDASGDKRWEDRDGRYKRTAGRDRKTNGFDDLKEKDERRDKEREKEKEPAWMDTYVPSESTPGILGGQAPTGELDGIQAWKKGMKEREHKEKDSINLVPPKVPEASQPPLPDNADKLDEIQLFKLLMKKEQGSKQPEGVSEGEGFLPTASKAEENTAQPWQRGEDALAKLANAPPKSDAFSSSKPSSPYPAQFPSGLKDLSTIAAQSSMVMDTQERTITSSLEPSLHSAKQSTDFGSSPGGGFQPPAGSRLLALAGRGQPKGPAMPQPLNGLQALPMEPSFPKNEVGRPSPGFSPFEEPSRQSYILEEPRDIGILQDQLSANRGTPFDQLFGAQGDAYNGMNTNKGSRFAKFFDGKGAPANANKPQSLGFNGNSPNPGQRLEQGGFGGLGPSGNGEQKTMEELFAMLNTSSQQQRSNIPHTANAPLGNNAGFNGHGNAGLHGFQSHQPQHLHQQQQQQHLINRLEPLYDSRSDDRSFVPDGMVPGLRPIPPPNPRRELPVHFTEQDDQMHYNLQRIAQQQQLQQQQQQQALPQRNLEPLYAGPNPALFAQQAGRHGLPLQNLQQPQPQPHFRGGPSPTLNQGPSLGNGPQQRLPPGLANLGGRPPHDPSQFIGLQGHPTGHHHNALPGNGLLPQQQQIPFNNFNAGNLNFNGGQGRGPGPVPSAGLQQLPLGNLGNPHMDPRLATHNHLMGLGGSGVGGNRMNGGGFPQQGPSPSHLGMRQQQQAQLPPHMHPHLLPPHMQHQGQPVTNNQAQDLMALLMGGHRD